MTAPLDCPHCGKPMFRASHDGSRVKARTSMLVMHKSGEVEINCPACRRGVIVPLTPVKDAPIGLRKAAMPTFIVPLDTSRPRRA